MFLSYSHDCQQRQQEQLKGEEIYPGPRLWGAQFITAGKAYDGWDSSQLWLQVHEAPYRWQTVSRGPWPEAELA